MSGIDDIILHLKYPKDDKVIGGSGLTIGASSTVESKSVLETFTLKFTDPLTHIEVTLCLNRDDAQRVTETWTQWLSNTDVGIVVSDWED